jgi:adhesin transport system outer membrane protein
VRAPGRRLALVLALAASLWAAAGAVASDASGERSVSWLRYAQAMGAPESPPGAAPPQLAAPPLPESIVALRLSDIAGLERVEVDPTLEPMRGQPRLEQADVRTSIERALAISDELAGAQARSLAQRFQIDVATGALRPRVDLRVASGMENSRPSARIDPDAGTPLASSTHGRDDSSLVLRQPLYDAGATSERDRQRALFGSSESGVAAARDQVAVDAATAHLDVLQFSLASVFARTYRVELEKLFAQVNARVEAGGASPAEAERVKARAINARSSVIEASGSLESALLSYRRLVGAVPGSIPTDDVLAPSSLPPLEQALTRARAENPGLASLRANQRAIEAEVEAARARLRPRLELEVGNYRTRGASGADGTTNEARAMLVLSWNLLSGGSDLAAANAAAARLDENRFRIRDAERRLEDALRISYNTLDAVSRRALSVREEFIANQRVIDAFRTQLLSGNRPLLDVLDAEQRLYQSRVELLRLTVLQASLTLQALRQIGLIGGAPAAAAPQGRTAPAPVVPAPTVPAPVAPAPVVPAPVEPAPVVPAPVPPAPTVPAPTVPAPTVPAPVPPALVAPAPVVPAPVPPAPVVPAPVPPAPVPPAPVAPAPVAPEPEAPAADALAADVAASAVAPPAAPARALDGPIVILPTAVARFAPAAAGPAPTAPAPVVPTSVAPATVAPAPAVATPPGRATPPSTRPRPGDR